MLFGILRTNGYFLILMFKQSKWILHTVVLIYAKQILRCFIKEIEISMDFDMSYINDLFVYISYFLLKKGQK